VFNQIYSNLCEGNKSRKENYKKYSGLHEHHVFPKHMGGDDSEKNLTYLSVREHIIAHYLLWKIYKNPNDLRSMKMLGANLSSQHRKITGEFCRDNQIGFFSSSIEERKEWQIKGIESQKQDYLNNKTKNFYYWSTEEGRKERASLGGKQRASAEFSYWASKEGRLERASLGGKSHKGKKVMHRPGDTTFIRVNPKDIDFYLEKGYIFGSPIDSPNKGIKTNKPSPRRKKVSDGINIYNSITDAALKNNITVGGIVQRCKSKKSKWHYVS